MKDLFDKYYVFTLVTGILAMSLYVFRADKDIVNIVIGCFIGLISAPYTMRNQKPPISDTVISSVVIKKDGDT